MTKLANLVNPEVMAEMIAHELPNKVKVLPLAKVDTTLAGRAGNTITVPRYEYIGDATEVAEGAEIDLTTVVTSTKQATIVKVAKAIELTDEAVLGGYGDPVGNAQAQLRDSIANAIDVECVRAYKEEAKLTYTYTTFGYDAIVEAVDVFGEEDNEEKYILVSPKHVTALRKDANFTDKTKYGNDVMVNGEIGMIANCRVVVTGKLDENTAIIAKAGALTVFMKRDVEVEADRDILKKTTVISADAHVVACVTDETGVVKMTK